MTALCGRTLSASCEIYLDAGEESAKSYLLEIGRRRRKRRGEAVEAEDPDACEEEALADLMTPAKLLHLAAYDAILAEAETAAAAAAAGGRKHIGVTDFADLAQSPFHQVPCRRGVAPALLRGSSLFSLSRRRPLLPCELMVVQGIPAGSSCSIGRSLAEHYPFKSIVEQDWPAAVIRKLAGNSMHICQVGSVISLIIALSAELTRSENRGQQAAADQGQQRSSSSSSRAGEGER